MGLAAKFLTVGAAFALSACASTHPQDPLEGYNRVVFGANQAIDEIMLRPAAEMYSTLPSFMQTGVYNFFGNLDDVGTALNNLLQGKVGDGVSDTVRVTLNTTVGIAGLFDVATDAGFYKNYEDFGQTLGAWGVGSGPYVVLPLLGPSTLRDTIAKPVDFKADPWHYVRPVRVRNTGSVLRAIDRRATLLGATGLLEDVALDHYQFMRDAYMQRRRNQVYDGAPPLVPEDED